MLSTEHQMSQNVLVNFHPHSLTKVINITADSWIYSAQISNQSHNGNDTIQTWWASVQCLSDSFKEENVKIISIISGKR